MDGPGWRMQVSVRTWMWAAACLYLHLSVMYRHSHEANRFLIYCEQFAVIDRLAPVWAVKGVHMRSDATSLQVLLSLQGCMRTV